MGLKLNDYMQSSLKLRDFQQEAIRFLLTRKKSLLALPVGSGKTITAFSTFTYFKSKIKNSKLIYITEKALIKQTIEQDLVKYFKGLKVVHLYNNNKRERTRIRLAWEHDADVIVMNYAAFRVDFKEWGESIGNIIKANYQLVSIFDEATAFKNPKAEISRCIHKLVQASHRSFGMTATPMVSGLMDCFYIMNCLQCSPYKTIQDFEAMHVLRESKKMFLLNVDGRKKMYVGVEDKKNHTVSMFASLRNMMNAKKPIKFLSKPSGTGFFQVIREDSGHFRMCVKEAYIGKTSFTFSVGNDIHRAFISCFDDRQQVGYKNIALFKKQAGEVMFVKAKAEIAKELPPITLLYHTCVESKESADTIAELYNHGTYAASQIEIALVTPQAYNEKVPKGFVSDKITQLLEYLKNDIPEEKVIIFHPFTQTTRVVKQILDKELKTNCAYVTGEVKDTSTELERFLSDPECRILIGTTTILKGMNLQAVNYICVLQCPYTFSFFQQLCGRINRIGSQSDFKIVKIFATEGARDEDIFKTVMQQAKLVRETDSRLVDEGIIPAWIDDSFKPMTEAEARQYLEDKLEKDKSKYI